MGLKSLYLRFLSRPAGDRPVYRAIAKQRVGTILELGVGTGLRAERLIQLTLPAAPEQKLTYVGVDLFETRRPADGPGLGLKAAHQKLTAAGARVKLLPGDPYSVLARKANELGQIDLLIISADQDAESLARAWFYVPRMLHERTLVFIEERQTAGGECQLRLMPRREIEKLAAGNQAGRRAA